MGNRRVRGSWYHWLSTKVPSFLRLIVDLSISAYRRGKAHNDAVSTSWITLCRRASACDKRQSAVAKCLIGRKLIHFVRGRRPCHEVPDLYIVKVYKEPLGTLKKKRICCDSWEWIKFKLAEILCRYIEFVAISITWRYELNNWDIIVGTKMLWATSFKPLKMSDHFQLKCVHLLPREYHTDGVMSNKTWEIWWEIRQCWSRIVMTISTGSIRI